MIFKYLNCAADKTIDEGHTGTIKMFITMCQYEIKDRFLNQLYGCPKRNFELE